MTAHPSPAVRDAAKVREQMAERVHDLLHDEFGQERSGVTLAEVAYRIVDALLGSRPATESHTEPHWFLNTDGRVAFRRARVTGEVPLTVDELTTRLNPRPAAPSGEAVLLTEALDLVPRVDDSDPMAPALRDWCRKVREALEAR